MRSERARLEANHQFLGSFLVFAKLLSLFSSVEQNGEDIISFCSSTPKKARMVFATRGLAVFED